MKMKKFLIIYFISSFFLSVLLALSLKETNGQEKIKIAQNNQKKKIIIISTEEFEPRGRVVCKNASESIFGFSDWMSAEDAVIVKIEMAELYRNANCEIFIQYDKWPY